MLTKIILRGLILKIHKKILSFLVGKDQCGLGLKNKDIEMKNTPKTTMILLMLKINLTLKI